MELVKNDINKKNYYLLLVVVFVGYFVFGLSENIKGPAIPRMQADFSLSEMHLGLLLSLNSLGYLLACGFTGFLSRKFGIKLSSMLAFGSMAVSGIFIYISRSFPVFSASYFLMYVGNGILEIALAILGARIFTRNTGMMMNLSHFFYGLSSTIAPIAATSLMGISLSGGVLGWKGMYLIMLSLSALPMLPSLLSKFPDNNIKEEDRMSIKDYLRDPAAWLLIVILSLGVVSELSIGGWLVNFLEKAYKWDMTASSTLLSAFFLVFMLSRLILGSLTDKIGLSKSLVLFSGLAGIFALAAVIIGPAGAFLFALAGAGIAPIYPTVMAILAKRYSKGSDTAISFTVTLMGIAVVIGNFLIGAIIDVFKWMFTGIYGSEQGLISGLQAGMIFIGLCAVFCSMTSLILFRFLKKQSEIL